MTTTEPMARLRAAADIPIAKTPAGGYGAVMPPPVLLGCVDPLVAGAVDMRGTWRVVEVTVDGVPAADSPLLGNVQRIEQAADRVCITSGGVVHDMRCDGVLEHGVHDVTPNGDPIQVMARFHDGAHELFPFGITDNGPLVTRRRDTSVLWWDYAGSLCRCERVRDEVPITIRPETDDDIEAIGVVVASAFGSETEARLVDRIRSSPYAMRGGSLVAVDDTEAVVGHVMVSHADLIDDRDVTHRVAMLSPLATRPDLQRRGIGSKLVRAAVDFAAAQGEALLVLEGDPRYYSRLGFDSAESFGLTLPIPDWAPPEAAQVYPLAGAENAPRGRVEYPAAFDELH